MKKQTSASSWIGAVVVVLAVVVLAVVVAGVYLARRAMQPHTPTVSAPAATASVNPGGAATPIQHPIDQASAPATASTAALPMLDDSDASVATALASLAGGGDLSSLLVSRQIITRVVTTIDALPRHDGLGSYTLPARTPKGTVATDEIAGATVIGELNSARYAPYMQIVDAVDPQALVSWYVRAYPLFQQAYRHLGYPKGYFNDRLIVAIDDLLAAPEPAQSPALIRSKAFYVYADPTLESLSTGQKLMLRVGNANEARIKTKLRAVRAALVGSDLHEVLPAEAPAAGAAEPPRAD